MQHQNNNVEEKVHLSEGNQEIPQPSTPTQPKSDKPVNQSTNSQGQNQQDQEQKRLVVSQPTQNLEQTDFKDGNYIVLFRNRHLTLSLGPDYLCFIPTFLIFAFFSYLIINWINHNVEQEWPKILTIIVCLGQCLSYLLVALSDPGIAHPGKKEVKKGTGRTIFCRRCRFNVPSKSFHCNYCDVCIMGYDHHCPWTSKCIGQNNLVRFYIFLFMTPIFIVYCAFAFGFTVKVEPSRHHLRGTPVLKTFNTTK